MPSFRDLTKNHSVQLGTYIGEFTQPGIGALLKSAGCEFVFLDMEHSGMSFETAKAVVRALHDSGIASLLRPPSSATHHIARACDTGAQGIIPPMMGSAAQAQGVIDAIKYPPLGTRGAAFGLAHDDFAPLSIPESIAQGNAKTSFVALIETAEGVDSVEEIASLSGCDAIWIGQVDLSISLGVPGEMDHPKLIAATDRIMTAAKSAGKPVGRVVGDADEAQLRISQGCTLICYSTDVGIYRNALMQGFNAIRAGSQP